MSLFTKPSDRQTDIGLTILRVAIGAIFMAHGGQKLFVWGFDGVASGFAQMGIPMASVMGPFIGLLEFFGGFALIVGLLTRLASLGLASTMVVAILVVHAKAGFFNPAGVEFPLSLLASTLLLVLTGAGSWSVDAIIARSRKVEAVETGRPAVRRAA